MCGKIRVFLRGYVMGLVVCVMGLVWYVMWLGWCVMRLMWCVGRLVRLWVKWVAIIIIGVCGACRVRWLGSCYIVVGYKTLGWIKTCCMAMWWERGAMCVRVILRGLWDS